MGKNVTEAKVEEEKERVEELVIGNGSDGGLRRWTWQRGRRRRWKLEKDVSEAEVAEEEEEEFVPQGERRERN